MPAPLGGEVGRIVGAVLLVAMLTLGALGLFLALPGGRAGTGRAALIVLIGAGAALLALLLPRLPGEGDWVWFVALALLSLWGAVRVITHSRPVYSALYFILVAVAVCGMLVLMQAGFLAASVFIIYAGAILVTYVFVIMLAQQSGGPAWYDAQAREPIWGIVSGFILLAVIGSRLVPGGGAVTTLTSAEAEGGAGTVVQLGIVLLADYVVGVQLAGVLLLGAMVGAIAIARRRPPEPGLEGAD